MEKGLVHIVDDEDAVRRSTGFMLRSEGYDVVDWTSGSEFLRQANSVASGCVLLDVRMPDIDGLEVQRTLAQRGVALPVIILTGHGDVGLAVRAMKGGAIDFLEKPFNKESLIDAIDAGFQHLSTSDGGAVRSQQAEALLAGLTGRERDVLDGLARGHPNKTIAFDLGISPRTVEVHRANLMAKLDVRSLSDALRIAFAAGLGH